MIFDLVGIFAAVLMVLAAVALGAFLLYLLPGRGPK